MLSNNDDSGVYIYGKQTGPFVVVSVTSILILLSPCNFPNMTSIANPASKIVVVVGAGPGLGYAVRS